ncbi:MAG: HTTM domain-containing protein [Bacteroidia bacterium]
MEISKYLKISFLKEKLSEPVHIAPLVVFRIIFGAVMLGAVIRFLLKGWVYELYIKPEFYFSYYGFEWVKPMGAAGMYIVFALMALSFLLIIFGYYYRLAAVTAFLTFTYVELIDKSNYLNHYYFVSVVCFLLIFLPAHKYFSLDAVRKPAIGTTEVPRYTISAIKLQLAIVYIFAGIAKLNYDWLYRAMPLKIWLPANAHLPVIGSFMDYEWVAYFFSWFGAIYDLFIVFFLMNSRTRSVAYIFVILFHLMTKWLFPIGMFPYVMIFCTLIFFSEDFHKKIIERIASWKPFYFISFLPVHKQTQGNPVQHKSRAFLWVLAGFFAFQLLLPWRFLLYPGNLFWTEQGYRFSWRVMLMEKAGTAFFYVKDPETGFESEVMNDEFLTKNQEKMMATQPDMILQYAHLLKEKYEQKGINNPQVRVESYVTLNGSGSRMFLDSSIDLAKEKESLLPKAWILPFEEKKSK